MKLNKTLSIITFVLIMISLSVKAEPAEQKIAVVDIQKVVASSLQVKDLAQFQETKNKEIVEFIEKAQSNVNKQKTQRAKKIAIEKYERQLIAKKEANIKNYKEKVEAADKNINKQINKIASDMGYTIVIPKMFVIYGGEDITDAIIKVVK